MSLYPITVKIYVQQIFHYVSCWISFQGRREETFFFYLPALIPTYMRYFKINCQGEVCKIDKPLR